MRRYGAWLDRPELIPPQEVAEDDALDLALDEGEWKGLAVYIFASGPWTVFEELSGGLAARPAEDWVRLADGGDLVYAGYNDAIGYGEFVRVDRGQLVRQFLQDEQDPTADVDVGKLPEEAGEPPGSLGRRGEVGGRGGRGLHGEGAGLALDPHRGVNGGDPRRRGRNAEG